MITFNLGNDSPRKDKQQDIKIADLQAAVDELNTQIDAISTTLGNLSVSIDDKYAAQTQTLMNALTAQINSLSSALESALTTGQLTAQIANIERLIVTVSAGFVALEAETAKIESLEAEDIESDSVKADSAEIQTLSAEKAVFNEATITLLNMLALTVQSLTADTASIKEVTAEKINSEKIETDLLNAEHIAGGAWHTPISTPDNTELLHISIPRYNGMAQLQTEDNEFNVSILNNYLVSYNQRGEYLYRIERKDESVDIYLQNIGDTVNYRVLFVGSETNGTVTSELVDKTAYRQTITDFAGVLSLESRGLDVNILFCDYLPDEGEENNLYVVKTQGSYLWNENAREFIPLMGTNWQAKILSNESKIGDLTELSTDVKTDLVSAINETRESLLSRILMAESDIRDLQTDVASLDRDKLSKTGGEVTELRVDRNLVVGGDLIVEGTSIITDEETIETSSDYAVLRKNNPAGLGLHEKSGVVINNYDGNGKNASIGVDTDGIFRISDNTSESITTYTNISKFGAVYYEGFNQDTRQTVTKGAIVSEIVDELSECAFDSVTEDYYHYKGEWYRVDLDNNHHSFRYDESSPVTDTQLLDRLVALTKDNLFYYWSLSVMTVDDVTNQPILTRSEAAELVDGAPLLWDATHNKAVKIAAPTSTDQVLGANGRTGAVMWTDQIETVSTLPVSPDIQTRIYKCAGKYYIGDKTTQILQELNYAVDTVENGNKNPVTSNAVYDKLNVLGTLYSSHVQNVPATGSSGWNYGVWEGTANLPKGVYLVHVITPNAGVGSVAGTGFACIVEGKFPAGYSNRVRSGLLGWNTGDTYPIDFDGFLVVPTSGSFTFKFDVYTNGGSFGAGTVFIDMVRLTTN